MMQDKRGVIVTRSKEMKGRTVLVWIYVHDVRVMEASAEISRYASIQRDAGGDYGLVHDTQQISE